MYEGLDLFVCRFLCLPGSENRVGQKVRVFHYPGGLYLNYLRRKLDN